MKEKYFSTIEEFIVITPAWKLIFAAFKEIKPTKKNIIVTIISLILAIVFAVRIGWYGNSVTLSLLVIGFLFNALLPIFGFLFTIYSLLLAFMNEDYIRELAKIDAEEKLSYLKKSTSYYESILFLHFIGVGITGVLYLCLNFINVNTELTSSRVLNNGLATFFLFWYFLYTFRIFLELKSTIYNTIVLFRASVAYKLLLIAKNESAGENSDKH